MNYVNTAVYVRVSTEEQALHGFSIRAQIEKLCYYAEKIKEWKVYDVYVDEGLSGKDVISRPSIKRMLEDIKENKVNNVLVFKIDRLTRSTKDLIELVEFFNNHNCDFNSLSEAIDTTTATGRMFIKIIGIFAEFERENIVERVKLGFERKVKEGYSICSSTPPYGYNRNKGENTLIINDEESKVVKKIFNLFLSGKTVSEIVNYLNLKKIKTKKDKKWTNKTVTLILSNSTYMGKVRYAINKKNYFEVDGFHESLINDKQFDKVKKMLQNSKKENECYDAYYSKRLKCKCGCLMVPKRVYKKDKYGQIKMYINYRCRDKKKGCSKDISHKKIDNFLSTYYLSWIELSVKEKNSILLRDNIELIYNDEQLIVNN